MAQFNLPDASVSKGAHFSFIGGVDSNSDTTCHVVPFDVDKIFIGTNQGTDLFTPVDGMSSITLVCDGVQWIAIALTGTWNLSGTVIVGP